MTDKATVRAGPIFGAVVHHSTLRRNRVPRQWGLCDAYDKGRKSLAQLPIRDPNAVRSDTAAKLSGSGSRLLITPSVAGVDIGGRARAPSVASERGAHDYP